MKSRTPIIVRHRSVLLSALLVAIGNSHPLICSAGTTIDAVNKHAYGANIGWVDWRGDTNNGAVIGEYVCSGYIWAANVGWIHLGNNAPLNGIHYRNDSAADYGVNHDGLGNLSGLAWGANIGWVVFTNATAAGPLSGPNLPRVDLTTGALSGYAYSANCGWISLSTAFAFVKTDTINPGADSDRDGISDAWELTYTNNLAGLGASGDADGDGVSDKDEYVAGTNPLDASDYLRITSITHGTSTPSYTIVTWTSGPTRSYTLQIRPALETGAWADLLAPIVGLSSVGFDQFGDHSFYRVRATLPLGP